MNVRDYLPPVTAVLTIVGLAIVLFFGPEILDWVFDAIGLKADNPWRGRTDRIPELIVILWSGYQWITKIDRSGILWWRRVLSVFRPIVVPCEVTASFQRDEPTPSGEIVQILQEWAHGDELTLSGESGDESAWQLNLHSLALGAITIRQTPVGVEEGHYYLTVTLPKAEREVRHFLSSLEGKFSSLLTSVSRVAGVVDGLILTANFRDQTNPYYGHFLRAEAERLSVSDFAVAFEPIAESAAGNEVSVRKQSITIQSREQVVFVKLARSYLWLEPSSTK